jgi:glyoxylase-like metal-dependent hydrolase (beta-lactamase superfamily II)
VTGKQICEARRRFFNLDFQPINEMSIRILNCGTIRPYFPIVESGVTCLLVETNVGPVLVDTGFGVGDYLHPGRLMRFFMAMMRSPRDIHETALYQVQRLGHRPADIRHIVMTHLHLDHAGGLPDFPHARVHIFRPEFQHIAEGHAGWTYVNAHWAHHPDWVCHQLDGQHWYDFEAIPLNGFIPEIWMIPLTGHTAGHSAVAIRTASGWIMHAGDAVPLNMAVDEVPDAISKLFLGPHVPRIRVFMKKHPEVQVVGAHMALSFYENP